jgi:exopolysaccharide production protein ExoQ
LTPSIACVLCWCGIAGLFYLDRDRSVRTSKALWLPVIYLWIVGSRSVSSWLGVTPAPGTNSQIDGSPLDATIYGLLLAAAIPVLVLRGKRTRRSLAASWPILMYLCYCLISVVWAFHPDVAFRRWIKSLDDLAMVLIIVTDPWPMEAIKRLIARMGFVLLPTSLLLIKYYGDLGRVYTVDGGLTNTGVTTDKNMLGVMLFVVSLFTLWRVVSLLGARSQPNRGRHLLAQGILLTFGVVLLQMADSKTSIACFILGGGLMFATRLRAFRSRPARVHALCLAVFLAGGAALLFGGGSEIAQAMGRKSDFSGRTEIWAALIPTAPGMIGGAGFESYWISPNVLKFQQTLRSWGWYRPEELNESHDGYLEVYLNLGLVGVSLISLILVSGYRRAIEAFRRSPSIGGLLISYVVVAVIYSITEAGFRMIFIPWIFLLLAVLTASCVTSGTFREEYNRQSQIKPKSNSDTVRNGPAGGPFKTAEEAAYVARDRMSRLANEYGLSRPPSQPGSVR